LVYGRFETRSALLNAILGVGRAYACAECDSGPEWRGAPMTLQIDHINGDNIDNREANLQFLCPNCHSQTPTYGGRNPSRHGHRPTT